MKLNMGCGFRKLEGYLNVDKFATCDPDMQVDLEVLPWPFATDSVEEVLFIHCLEHLGAATDTFLGIMRELHRVCRHGATVKIIVPHHRHDHFTGDPTHVRIINPMVLSLFSKKNNLHWKQQGFANSPLALYLDIDFELIESVQVLEKVYQDAVDRGMLSTEALNRLERESNNIVQEYRCTLKVLKE